MQFYIQGYTEQQVRDKIKELELKYKITQISVGRYIGTSEYYGDIYYTCKYTEV